MVKIRRNYRHSRVAHFFETQCSCLVECYPICDFCAAGHSECWSCNWSTTLTTRKQSMPWKQSGLIQSWRCSKLGCI